MSLLHQAAACAEAAGDPTGAAAALTLALTADPAGETAHQGLMRLHARAGRREDALRQYRLLREALRQEGGDGPASEPDPASQRLYQDILAGPGPRAQPPRRAASEPQTGAPARRPGRHAGTICRPRSPASSGGRGSCGPCPASSRAPGW